MYLSMGSSERSMFLRWASRSWSFLSRAKGLSISCRSLFIWAFWFSICLTLKALVRIKESLEIKVHSNQTGYMCVINSSVPPKKSCISVLEWLPLWLFQWSVFYNNTYLTIFSITLSITKQFLFILQYAVFAYVHIMGKMGNFK